MIDAAYRRAAKLDAEGRDGEAWRDIDIAVAVHLALAARPRRGRVGRAPLVGRRPRRRHAALRQRHPEGQEGATRWRRKSTKSGHERPVPLPVQTVEALRQLHEERQPADTDGVLQLAHPDVITDRWRKLAAAEGISGTFHHLRHLSASYKLAKRRGRRDRHRTARVVVDPDGRPLRGTRSASSSATLPT